MFKTPTCNLTAHAIQRMKEETDETERMAANRASTGLGLTHVGLATNARAGTCIKNLIRGGGIMLCHHYIRMLVTTV